MDFFALIKNFHVSWKTSLLGLSACALYLHGSPAFWAFFDNDPATVGSWLVVLKGTGMALFGAVSRDGDKSSEHVGIS